MRTRPRVSAVWLTSHSVETAPERGLAGLANRDLIDAAENAGFDVFVTADQNLKYQQNLTGRRLALVVLTTNHWDTIRPGAARIVDLLDSIEKRIAAVERAPRS